MLAALFRNVTSTTENIVPVSFENIIQLQSPLQHPAETKVDADTVCMGNEQICVPSEGSTPKLRIVVEAHSGAQSKGAYKAKLTKIRQRY